jgi:hypothetical protein
MQADVSASQSEKAAVLTKAVVRTAGLLEIAQRDLAEILSVSPATVTRMIAGDKKLPPGKSSYQLGALFVRVFRSLDTLVGGNPLQARLWFRADNHHLKGVPLELAKTVRGLVHVADYLDAMRGTL